MKRTDAGWMMLALIAITFVVITVWIVGRAAWQSQQIRDVPATATTTVRVVVLPTQTVVIFDAPTREVVVIDQLPIGPTSTRAPLTATPTPEPPTATPTINTTPPVQRG